MSSPALWGADVSLGDTIKVDIQQFYGIEIEKFPCQVAQVGMWLTEHQMNRRAGVELGIPYTRLPLKHSATIVEGNALRMDWTDVLPNDIYIGQSAISGLQNANSFAKRRYANLIA